MRGPPSPAPASRWPVALAAAMLAIAGRPAPAAAQTQATVEGRVVDAESGEGLPNAIVTLERRGSVLSGDEGTFRFEHLPGATYELRVTAFGYRDTSSSLVVRGDTAVVVALDALPVEVEGFDVTLGTFDFHGRVRDPRTGRWVYEALVTSDQGHRESTSLRGQFTLDDVFDGPRIRLAILAFGFMPLDTTFVPDDEERYPFDLTPDPVMGKMIDQFVVRLDERAGTHMYEYQSALNRADLAEFRENASLRQLIEVHYPRHVVRRVRCLILDEREYRINSAEENVSVFEGTFANELERVELLEFPGYGRLFMLRVYTRRYFIQHVGSDEELIEPWIVETPGGMTCR